MVAPNIEEALAQAKQKTGNASLTTADLRQEEDCLDGRNVFSNAYQSKRI